MHRNPLRREEDAAAVGMCSGTEAPPAAAAGSSKNTYGISVCSPLVGGRRLAALLVNVESGIIQENRKPIPVHQEVFWTALVFRL